MDRTEFDNLSLTVDSVRATIAEIESTPKWNEKFSPTRYPYTYAYDYLRTHANQFGLPGNAEIISRADCSAIFWGREDKDEICKLLADAYLRQWGIKKPGEEK